MSQVTVVATMLNGEQIDVTLPDARQAWDWINQRRDGLAWAKAVLSEDPLRPLFEWGDLSRG